MNKMERYYNELGFDTYIKEFILDDNELSDTINKVDTMLKETNDSIGELCKMSILKYKEG